MTSQSAPRYICHSSSYIVMPDSVAASRKRRAPIVIASDCSVYAYDECRAMFVAPVFDTTS